METKQYDECWVCGNEIVSNDLYLDLMICLNGKDIQIMHRIGLCCAKDFNVGKEDLESSLECHLDGYNYDECPPEELIAAAGKAGLRL